MSHAAALRFDEFIADYGAVEQSAAFLAEDVFFEDRRSSLALTRGAIAGIVLAVLLTVFMLILVVAVTLGYINYNSKQRRYSFLHHPEIVSLNCYLNIIATT